MKRRAIRWVTFDLDGTLLDTVGDLHAACAGMLADLGRSPRSAAEVRRFVGQGMRTLVERCLDGEGQTDASLLETGIASFRAHYARENGRQAVLYPGVLSGLRAFAALDLPLALVTNKPMEFTEPLLERTGLRPFFSEVLGGDSLPHKKPHPAQLLHICKKFGQMPPQGLHIGDSAHDLAAARAAGMRFFCVPYGYADGAPMDSADCDALVSSLVDAAHWVGEYNHAATDPVFS